MTIHFNTDDAETTTYFMTTTIMIIQSMASTQIFNTMFYS